MIVKNNTVIGNCNYTIAQLRCNYRRCHCLLYCSQHGVCNVMLCAQVDERIREGFREYLYNNGRGQFVHLSEILHVRGGGRAVRSSVSLPGSVRGAGCSSKHQQLMQHLGVSQLEAMADDDSEYVKKNGQTQFDGVLLLCTLLATDRMRRRDCHQMSTHKCECREKFTDLWRN